MLQTAEMVVMNETVISDLMSMVCTRPSYYGQGSVWQGAVFWICLQELSDLNSLWEIMGNGWIHFSGMCLFAECDPEPISII